MGSPCRHHSSFAQLVSVFTQRCAVCNQPGATMCRRCRFLLAASPPVRIGGPLLGSIEAALTFDGTVRSAILALKFANRRAVAGQLAALVVRRLALDRSSCRFDLVTWAPTSRRRSARRGYDQAELIARAIARELGVPCRRLLYRAHGAPQAGRNRADRLLGPTFRARRARNGLRVLVIDDVVTTGATLLGARRALLAAGVGDVRAIAVAAAPAPGLLRRAS